VGDDHVTGVVVAGTGFGCFTHVRALRAAGFDVLAVVGRDAVKTKVRAEACGVARALTSFDDALALPGVDAVTIATPPHTHAELVRATLTARKHVLCEKPLARDANEARTLLVAARDAGVVHLLGTEFRFDPGQALLARVVRDGAIGEPRLATILLHVPMLADHQAELPDWWADASAGGGWFGAHGSQVIDQVRATLGDFVGVSASLLHVAGRPMTADDGFTVHFRMQSGAAGLMQSTAGDRGPPLIVTRVVGSRGTAWIEGLGADVVVADEAGARTVDVPDDLRTLPPAPPPRELLTTGYEQMIGHGLDFGPYTRLCEHFLARIRGVAPPPGPSPATFSDGVAAMDVLDAVRESAAAGEWVVIGERTERRGS
jgi:predicted dehydrogenase